MKRLFSRTKTRPKGADLPASRPCNGAESLREAPAASSAGAKERLRQVHPADTTTQGTTSTSSDEYYDACSDLSECDVNSPTAGRASSSPNPFDQSYPAHRAAFADDISTLELVWKRVSREEWDVRDPAGNTPLHVAVLLGHHRALNKLLELGYPCDRKNERGWSALDEAVALGDEQMVKILLLASHARRKQKFKEQKPVLLQSLAQMPDFKMSVKWEFGSALFGKLIQKFAPHDVYSITKQGTSLRVDGTLMGINEKSASLVPEWKRGHFSLLFTGKHDNSQLLLVDHTKKTVVDAITRGGNAFESDLNHEVAMLMAEGASKRRFEAKDVQFKPAKSWLGYEVTEQVEGWKTRVYEGSGTFSTVHITKPSLMGRYTGTFESYLSDVEAARAAEERLASSAEASASDRVVGVDDAYIDEDLSEQHVHQNNQQLLSNESTVQDVKSRRIKAKCWMAQGFPLTVAQLLPLMEVVEHANRHLGRVTKYLRKHSQKDMFPVKLQVPLIMTVYALVTFKNFEVLSPSKQLSSAFFSVPAGYSMQSLDQILKKLYEEEQAWHMSDDNAEEVIGYPLHYDQVSPGLVQRLS
eukprot:jgi/Chlat1/1387/Chrsp12S01965